MDIAYHDRRRSEILDHQRTEREIGYHRCIRVQTLNKMAVNLDKTLDLLRQEKIADLQESSCASSKCLLSASSSPFVVTVSFTV